MQYQSFVDLYLDQYGPVTVSRLDNDQVCMLKGDSLRRAESMIDIYNYSDTRYGISGDIEVEVEDFTPIDMSYAFGPQVNCY
jgi:hypothetical protein